MGPTHIASMLREAWRHPAVRILVSMAFSLILTCYMSLSDMLNDFDDDWAISVALSGRYPDSGLCLFVNAVISNVTFALNQIAPSLNWFLVIEYLLSFISFSVMIYAAITFMNPILGLGLVAGCEYFLLPNCVIYSNFTFVSAFCTIAGFTLLLSMLKRGGYSRSGAVLGVFLCACGFAFRANAFLLCVPFFGVALLLILIEGLKARRASASQDKENSESDDSVWCERSSLPRCVALAAVPFACLLIVCSALYLYNEYAWSQPGWSAWREWNEARSQISDYKMPAYAEVMEELAPLGITEDAYYLATHWASGDVEFFDQERMDALASVSHAASLPTILAQALRYPFSLSLDSRTFIFAVVMLIAAIALSRPRKWPWMAAVFMIAVLAAAFFFGLGRLLDRVVIPIYISAGAALVIMAEQEKESCFKLLRFSSTHTVLTCASAFVLCALTVHLVSAEAKTVTLEQGYYMTHQEEFHPQGELVEYALRNDGRIYVWDTLDFTGLERSYQLRYLPSREFLEKNISIGGWSTDSPYINARNAMVGMPNVVRGLVENECAYFICSDLATTEHLLGFIRSEYHSDAMVQQVDMLHNEKGEPCYVYKFRVP